MIDDEVDLADLAAFNLRQAGFHVDTAHTAEAGLAQAFAGTTDVVVLDLMLPDRSGIDVCRQLRANPVTADLAILMVTARGEEIDRIVGFEIGTDDYLVKPFSPRELVLRVQALFRRACRAPHGGTAEREGQTTESGVVSRTRIGVLRVDVEQHRVWVREEEVVLTALEFRLLLDLIERSGRVQSRDALLERVWGYAAGISTRTVDTHVKRLREKLGEAANLVETVRGVGYRLSEDSAGGLS